MKALIGLITILIAAGCSPTVAALQRIFGGARSRKRRKIRTANYSRYCYDGGGDDDCYNGCYYYYYYSDDVRCRRRYRWHLRFHLFLRLTTSLDHDHTNHLPYRWRSAQQLHHLLLPLPQKKNNEDDDDQMDHCHGEHLNCI